jgi:hypothetical protein
MFWHREWHDFMLTLKNLEIMKEEIKITALAMGVIAGLFFFEQCTEGVYKKEVKEAEPVADIPFPEDLPLEWTEDGIVAAAEPAQSEPPKAEATLPEPPKPVLAENPEDLKGVKKVNAEIKGAFQTMADEIGAQVQKIDQAAVVTDMKLQANRLDNRIDRLEAKMAKQLGLCEAEAEARPLRQMHSDLLDQIAAAEQADASDWHEVRPDQRYSFKTMRDDLREEIALTGDLLEAVEEAEQELASGEK